MPEAALTAADTAVPAVAELAGDVLPEDAGTATVCACWPDGFGFSDCLPDAFSAAPVAAGSAFRSMACTASSPFCSTISRIWPHSGQSTCLPTNSFSRTLSRDEQCGQAKWNGSMRGDCDRSISWVLAQERNGFRFFFSAVGTLVIVAVLLFSSTIRTSWFLPFSMLPSMMILCKTAVAGTSSIANVW